MTINHKIAAALFLGLSATVTAQIKEEKLILDRKREPEVRKIEKKQTSVSVDKNYPPKEKKTQDSLNLRYDITDVPAVSDFRTSKIEGTDISPDFTADYQNNYIRIGGGNFGKVLADATVSGLLENKMQVGADLHYLSTTGLQKIYPWSSRQMAGELSGFLNHYGEAGKANVTAGVSYDDYNYYGIYAFTPDADADLKQKTTKVSVNGFYDFYSNNYLDDLRVKTAFLGDHFGAREALGGLNLNLAENDIELPGNSGITLNTGLGLGLDTQRTTFDILSRNSANFLDIAAEPKLTFYRGDSYLRLGVSFHYLDQKHESQQIAGTLQNSKVYWFPNAELLFGASPQVKFYAGVDGGIKLNSYGDLLQVNPYLVSDQILRPTVTKYHAYVGLKGDIDTTLKYDISGGYGKVENAVFYTHNTLFEPNMNLSRSPYDYLNTMSAVYDNGTVSTVKGSVSYFPLQNLALRGTLNYSRYTLDNLDDAYYINRGQAEIGAECTMLNSKLLLGFTGLFGTGNTVNVYEYGNNPAIPVGYLPTLVSKKVDGYADLNLSAEYKLHKNFSIFALGNNLLNNNYQNFYSYRVLGAQVVGGVKLSF